MKSIERRIEKLETGTAPGGRTLASLSDDELDLRIAGLLKSAIGESLTELEKAALDISIAKPEESPFAHMSNDHLAKLVAEGLCNYAIARPNGRVAVTLSRLKPMRPETEIEPDA